MIRRALLPPLALALLAVLAPAQGSTTIDDEAWFVVSHADRIRSGDRRALEDAGARAIMYRHPDAYVARLRPDAAATLRARRTVTSIERLAPAEKIASTARPGIISIIAAASRSNGAAAWQPHDVVERLARVAPVARATLFSPDGTLLEVVARADAAQIDAIARDPAVLSIGRAPEGIELLEEATAQIVAGNIEDGRPVPGYRAFLDELGLGGEGVRIAIADSGIDDTHPDLAGRVAARTDFTPLPDHRDSDGHGTHVAGIAGGSGAGLPLATDRDGLAYGMGVAPDVTLIDIGVLGILEEVLGIDELPPFEQATSFAVRNGAVAWNASWGTLEGDNAGYLASARTLDILTRDADWEEPGAQPFIMVHAAGNSGAAGIGAPAEAKNLIVVAASRAARAGNIEQISGFSSRGPTADGRIGPTVAAPGEAVVSTRALPISVLCNVPPNDRTPMSPFYGLCSGTSMATPHVTGAVAVLTQWWRGTQHGLTPSPAMARALLVNSATDIGAPDIPNGAEGWGRVNLGALLDPMTQRIADDQTIVFDDVDDSSTLRIQAADPSKPLKITIAWSDAPGEPNADIALVNDLDLRVLGDDGSVYLGNVFANGSSAEGGAPDRRETLENVFIAAPSAGVYTIEIRAANLPGDGVPFAGDGTDQDVALIASNAIIVP